MIDLAKLRQENAEIVEKFIMRFKRGRLRCQTPLLETEYIKFAVGGLNFELRKKNFYYLFDLSDKASRYESLLREATLR